MRIPYFIFLKNLCHTYFFVCGSFDVRMNEALPTIKSSGIGPIARISGVEDLISGHEVPVFLERVFPDQGVSDVELALLRVYWSLGFVSDQVTIKREI